MSDAAQVRWAKGGEAIVESLRDDAITLRSTVPSPPGSRIEGALGAGGTLRVKIHGSRKQPDGRFVLDGRVLDLTRDLRARLEAAIASRTAPSDPSPSDPSPSDPSP